ncbi:MAG: HNH endonuclease [Nitrospirota bacterium]
MFVIGVTKYSIGGAPFFTLFRFHTREFTLSHIVPWSVNVSLRMNPQNGICMCALHDKAFDRGLITISDNYRLLVSTTIKNLSDEVAIQRGFLPYQGIEVRLPDKFLPEKKFIEYHREKIFTG